MKIKHLLVLAVIALLSLNANYSFAQGLALNSTGAVADTSAMLDIASTSKGVLVPRMTNSARGLIVMPANGLLIFQTDGTPGFYYNSGTPGTPVWTAISGGSGTVTAVSAGTGLSGGTITSSGTISLPNTGTAGTYGSASLVPVLTTDAQGRVISVTNTSISGGAGTVTSVTDNTGLAPLFTSSTVTGTTTPVITYSLSPASSYSVLTNSTNATVVPAYGPVVPQALQNLGGTPSSSTFYRGDGNWAAPSSFTFMTEAAKNALVSPALNTVIYQTDGYTGIYVYQSDGWRCISGDPPMAVINLGTDTTATGSCTFTPTLNGVAISLPIILDATYHNIYVTGYFASGAANPCRIFSLPNPANCKGRVYRFTVNNEYLTNTIPGGDYIFFKRPTDSPPGIGYRDLYKFAIGATGNIIGQNASACDRLTDGKMTVLQSDGTEWKQIQGDTYDDSQD